MDPTQIAQLISLLGPLVVPLFSAVTTALFHWFIGKLSPATKAVINPFLPAVSALSGMAIGYPSGLSPMTGAVFGLAGTGIHQLLTQPVKAATKK